MSTKQVSEKKRRNKSSKGQWEELGMDRDPLRDYRDLHQVDIHESVNGVAALQASEDEEAITPLAETQTVEAALELREETRWFKEAKEKNLSPLYLAAEAGDTSGVQALLQCAFDTVHNQSEEVKKYFSSSLEERVNKAEETKFQSTPLHVAAREGHTQIMSLLLSHGANVEAMDKLRWTPLHVAAREGHTQKAMSLLLSHRANIEMMDGLDQRTPLHFAAQNELTTEPLSFLLSQRANIEAVDKDQRTPLHFAAQNELITEPLSFLLSQRANIEAVDKNGSTPLHFAAENGQMETASLLLSHKANIEAMDKNGSTPLHIAARNRHTKTMSLLLSHRAKYVKAMEKASDSRRNDIC